MFTISRIIMAVLVVCATAVAQEAGQQAPAPTPAPKHRHAQGDRAEQRLKRLSKRLSLTDDQKEKLRPILQDEQKQMKAVDDDTTMTQQQKHRKMREIRMSSRSQMDSILTDEQKQKLQSERPHGAGPHLGRHTTGSGTTTYDQSAPQ